MPIRQKYRTRAAEWYRKNLRALAENKLPPSPLPPGTGRLPASGTPCPTQMLLDQVFAEAPCDIMTGGTHSLGMESGRCIRDGKVKKSRNLPYSDCQPHW